MSARLRCLLVSIFLIGPYYCDAFYVPSKDIEKCDLGDSLGIVLCISPVTSLFEGNLNLSNITRARGLRILDECRNATTCISQYACATNVKLDKTFGLLCDAFSYFSTDFAPCQKKILANMPPCMREAEKTLLQHAKIREPCELINKTKECFQTEVTNICGESYWTPVQKIWSKMEVYSLMKC